MVVKTAGKLEFSEYIKIHFREEQSRSTHKFPKYDNYSPCTQLSLNQLPQTPSEFQFPTSD